MYFYFDEPLPTIISIKLYTDQHFHMWKSTTEAVSHYLVVILQCLERVRANEETTDISFWLCRFRCSLLGVFPDLQTSNIIKPTLSYI